MRNCRWLSLVLDLGSPTWQSRGAESTVTAAPPNSKQKDRVNIAFPEVLATLCAFIDAFALQHRDNIICIYGCNAVKVDPIFIGLARLKKNDFFEYWKEPCEHDFRGKLMNRSRFWTVTIFASPDNQRSTFLKIEEGTFLGAWWSVT